MFLNLRAGISMYTITHCRVTGALHVQPQQQVCLRQNSLMTFMPLQAVCPPPRLIALWRIGSPVCSTVLPMAGGRRYGFMPFPRTLVSSFNQNLNSAHQLNFSYRHLKYHLAHLILTRDWGQAFHTHTHWFALCLLLSLRQFIDSKSK